MSWSYRIIRYKDGSGYGMHEVYYDDEGKPWAMTNNPISFSVDAEEGSQSVISALCMALKDALQYPVFDQPERWPGRAP